VRGSWRAVQGWRLVRVGIVDMKLVTVVCESVVDTKGRYRSVFADRFAATARCRIPPGGVRCSASPLRS